MTFRKHMFRKLKFGYSFDPTDTNLCEFVWENDKRNGSENLKARKREYVRTERRYGR